MRQKMNEYFWNLNDKNPSYDLLKAIFIKPSYLKLYRLIICIFYIVVTILEFISSKSLKPFVYLTFWGFEIGTIYFILATIETIYCKGKNIFLWKITHILFEMAISIEFMIVIFFWAILFPENPNAVLKDSFSLVMNIFVHLLGFVFLWVDNIFNKIRIYPKHYVFILIFAFVYGILINLPYSLANKPVYPPIDWISLSSYLFLLMATFLSLFHHFAISYCFFRYVKEKVKEKGSKDDTLLIN